MDEYSGLAALVANGMAGVLAGAVARTALPYVSNALGVGMNTIKERILASKKQVLGNFFTDVSLLVGSIASAHAILTYFNVPTADFEDKTALIAGGLLAHHPELRFDNLVKNLRKPFRTRRLQRLKRELPDIIAKIGAKTCHEEANAVYFAEENSTATNVYILGADFQGATAKYLIHEKEGKSEVQRWIYDVPQDRVVDEVVACLANPSSKLMSAYNPKVLIMGGNCDCSEEERKRHILKRYEELRR